MYRVPSFERSAPPELVQIQQRGQYAVAYLAGTDVLAWRDGCGSHILNPERFFAQMIRPPEMFKKPKVYTGAYVVSPYPSPHFLSSYGDSNPSFAVISGEATGAHFASMWKQGQASIEALPVLRPLQDALRGQLNAYADQLKAGAFVPFEAVLKVWIAEVDYVLRQQGDAADFFDFCHGMKWQWETFTAGSAHWLQDDIVALSRRLLPASFVDSALAGCAYYESLRDKVLADALPVHQRLQATDALVEYVLNPDKDQQVRALLGDAYAAAGTVRLKRDDLPAVSAEARSYFWMLYDFLKMYGTGRRPLMEAYKGAARQVGYGGRGNRSVEKVAESMKKAFNDSMNKGIEWKLSTDTPPDFYERVLKIGKPYEGED